MNFLRDVFRRSLQKHPILTNAGVYMSFYTAAEFSQQTVRRIQSPQKSHYDFAAIARVTLVGGTLYAPTLYVWYKYLDNKFVGTAMKTVLTKVAADQFLMSPVLLFGFYTAMAILERRKDLFEEVREKYAVSFVANQLFWIPGQCINFYYVPSHLRVVYVACVSFMWINIICYIKRQKLKSELSEFSEVTKLNKNS